jgi:hypothetical protein
VRPAKRRCCNGGVATTYPHDCSMASKKHHCYPTKWNLQSFEFLIENGTYQAKFYIICTIICILFSFARFGAELVETLSEDYGPTKHHLSSSAIFCLPPPPPLPPIYPLPNSVCPLPLRRPPRHYRPDIRLPSAVSRIAVADLSSFQSRRPLDRPLPTSEP